MGPVATIVLALVLCWWSSAVDVSAQPYTNVVPNDAELYAMCGQYALHTPTFDCNAFSNATGYSQCTGAPYQCQCLPEAPFRFQQPPVSIMCKYNYGVEPCTSTNEAKYFCGVHASGCTKRCDYLGNCYAADVCQCETGYTMPTNPQYCSYAYQADMCLSAPTTNAILDRDTTACGVFASQAFYICPNGTDQFNPDLCIPRCNCLPDTGRTPGSLVDCDGVNRDCNPAEVLAICGEAYASCQKRCQFTNADPTNQGNCVILPGTCVSKNATIPPSGTFPCPANQINTLCGPATASCVQYKSAGVVVNTSCTCTSTGVQSFSGTLKCDEWNAYVAADYSLCAVGCGIPGYLDGDQYPCAYRRYITPAPSSITAPAGYSDHQKQVYWLTVGWNNIGLVTWNPQAISWIDQPISQVRLAASQNNLNTYAYMLHCTCDSAPLIAASQALGIIESPIPSIDLDSVLLQGGAGYNWQFDTTTQAYGNFLTGRPIRLSLNQIASTYVLYPLDTNAPIGNFYQVPSCAGPVIASTAAVALNSPMDGNDNDPDADPPSVVSITELGADLFQLCHASNLCAYGCTKLTPTATTVPPGTFTAANAFQVLSPWPDQSNWAFTVAVLPNGASQFTYYSFNCPNQDGFANVFNLPRNGEYINITLDGLPYQNIPYVDVSNIYGARAYSEHVCSGKGVLAQYTKPAGNLLDLRRATGFQLVDAQAPFLVNTLLVNYTVFYVVPVSALPTAVQGLSTNGYGPIGVNTYTDFQCACYGGWGGPICAVNVACDPCKFGGDCTVPESACLPSSVSYTPSPQSTAVLRYDQTYNNPPFSTGPPIMSTTNCPFSASGTGVGTCDLALYRALVGQYCANGVPRDTPDGIVCDCKPGWTRVTSEPWNGCTIATVNPPNCPVRDNTCDGFGYSQRPPQCICGGHGTIDETGNCICNINWRKDASGCCSIPNICPDCRNITLTHIDFCNITTAGAEYVCSTSTSGGSWTGACCNVFEPTVPCVHGIPYSGEWVYNYTGSLPLVPLVFPGSPAPGYNPNGAWCNCQGDDQWTGESCDMSPCPSANGVICNGRGTCVEGRCMQDNGCTDPDYWGCACQFNLLQSCRGAPDVSLCSSRGQCGATSMQNLSLSCACDQGYGGQYCSFSACGTTDCGSSHHGGNCVRNDTTGEYGCQCFTVDPFACDGQGCLWGGPTCDLDITDACGFNNRGRATVCNQHGYCNTTLASPQCVCTDGWISAGNKCTTQPCSPTCGPNGNCVPSAGGPVCSCNPFWAGPSTSPPCSINQCIYGRPSSPNLGATCVCNNTDYTYASQCTLLDCTRDNGVPCGQVNCALTTSCQTGTNTCRPGCTQGSFVNTCFNGTCTCHPSSKFNQFLGYCESVCAPWPQTKAIDWFTTPGTVVCTCNPALGLDPAPPSYCRQKICQNNGVYLPESGGCICKPGWTGSRCTDQLCSGHGVFNNGTTNDCSCFAPWTGPTCQQNTCQNGGVPVENGQIAPDWECECPVAYRGVNCEFDQCQPHGHASLDGSMCVCDAGWYGIHCQFLGCFYPNVQFNDTCQCNINYYGPACQWLRCGPAGNYHQGQCFCGGVSVLRNDSGVFNCTGNTCGRYGLPSNNLGTCFCNARAVFVPILNATNSYNCVPRCVNGGRYNNTLNTCVCPPHTTGDFCEFGPSSTGVSSSSSTGGRHGNSSSSSTGRHPSSTGWRRHQQPSLIFTFAVAATLLYALFVTYR